MDNLLGLATLRVAKTYYNHFSCLIFFIMISQIFFHYDFTDFNTEYQKYIVIKKTNFKINL